MNIVLSRLDRIGDLVLSTPAIASVRRSWPEAHVTIVCSGRNAGVVERSPDVDEVVIAPSGVKSTLVGERYRGRTDLAIALAPCTADFELVHATGAPLRVGYTYVRRYLARAAAHYFLTRVAVSEADPDLCERDPGYRVRHEVDQVLDVVQLAGGEKLAHDLVVPVGDAERAAVGDIPAGSLTFHIGARWFSAGSTLESVIVLLRDLRRFGLPIVVTCGSESRAEAMRIRDAGVADAVLTDLPFLVWAAAFERARVVITVDTGATHVASAMRRPTVVVFERRWFRLSAQEWAPYRVPSVSLCKPPDDSEASLACLRTNIAYAVESLLDGEGTHSDA
jgi:heptosyltransferase-1